MNGTAKPDWTKEQKDVFEAPVQDLLVSAAAGSGKTAVLTERIVKRIRQGELDVQSVLVMTFTEAAARQMKEKIATRLEEARAAETDLIRQRELGRQQTLLAGAAISTIHAFCLTVVRNFSHLACDAAGNLLLEPGFSVADQQTADLLLRESLESVLRARYEQIDQAGSGAPPAWAPAFYHLVDSCSSSRSDQILREQIIRLYYYLRSLPDYETVVVNYRADLAAAAADFSASRYAAVLRGQLRVLLGQAGLALPEFRDLLERGVTLIQKDPVRNLNYQTQFLNLANVLEELTALLHQKEPAWDEIVDRASRIGQLELPRAGGKDPDKARFLMLFRQNLAETVHALTGQCHTETYRQYFLADTTGLFTRRAAEIERDIAAMLPAVNQLFDLVLELDQTYRQQKRDMSLIDFSDFEHLALTILRQDEAAAYYRGRFSEIYIDEYQDTSSIQEAILAAVSSNNIFMVGDVKQSIYRFRHARPTLFLNRYQAFHAAMSGQLLTLGRNFRSVPGILEAVNDVFLQLLSPQAGEIDYADGHQLTPYRQKQDGDAPVELLLVRAEAPAEDVKAWGEDRTETAAAAEKIEEETEDGTGTDRGGAGGPDELPADLAELSQYQRESLFVCRKIRGLLDAGTCQPRDIAILARTRAIVRTCAATLRDQQIAVLEDTGHTFLESVDLRLIRALLATLDNPRQDIPLTAVMRSGLFEQGFQPEELLAIRLEASRAGKAGRFFHEAVAWYREQGKDEALRERLVRFQTWLDLWRSREKFRPTGEWLDYLLESSGFYRHVAGEVNGAERLREVKAFVSWVHQYERPRQRGLFDLVRYLEKLEQNGLDQAPYDGADSEQNAVRVMTIHSSKGLEFPFVFVVGLAAALKPKERDNFLMVSETLGIGFDFVSPDEHVRRMSHLKLAMLAENKAASLAEEQRLLYVAMTRARDRLFLSACLPAKGLPALAARLNQVRSVAEVNLPPHLVLAGRSYLDWLLMALCRHPELAAVLPPELNGGAGASDDGGEEVNSIWPLPVTTAWNVQVVSLADLAAGPSAGEAAITMAEPAAAAGSAPLPEAGKRAASLFVEQDPAAVAQARTRLCRDYRYSSAAKSPVKLSVSELKRPELAESRFADDQTLDLPVAAAGAPRGINLELVDLDRLTQISAGPVRGAALGTALHNFLRYLDLPAARRQATAAELQRQLASLTAEGIFQAAEEEALRSWVAAVLTFVQSDLAGRMVEADVTRRQLYREMPFTLALPAQTVWPAETAFAADDRALVQGIIDCWFLENGRAVLVDYKTDRIAGAPADVQTALCQRYERQLDYYARAISAGTGLPVDERLIVHIPSRQIFNCLTAAPD